MWKVWHKSPKISVGVIKHFFIKRWITSFFESKLDLSSSYLERIENGEILRFCLSLLSICKISSASQIIPSSTSREKLSCLSARFWTWCIFQKLYGKRGIIRPPSEITLTPSVLTQSLSKVAWFHLECLRCESQRAQQKSNVVTQPFVPALEIHAPWHDSDLSCDKMALTFFFFAFMLCLNCCVMSMIRLFLTFYHSKHQPYSFMFV